MKVILKSKQELTTWEARKIKDLFKDYFMAFNLDFLFMCDDDDK